MKKKSTQTRELLVSDRGPELFEMILSRITMEKEGTPYQICQKMGVHWGGLLSWVGQDSERQEKLKFAMEVRAHLLAEDALVIADKAKPKTVNVAKLQVDTRKWLASRFNPKQFGEKQEIEHSGEVTGSLMHILQSLPRAVEEKVIPEELTSPDTQTAV